jgi:hypothetical protein
MSYFSVYLWENRKKDNSGKKGAIHTFWTTHFFLKKVCLWHFRFINKISGNLF